MPEVVSIALGGGTKVEEKDGKVLVGPESVGYRLLDEGLVFGGNVLTVTGKFHSNKSIETPLDSALLTPCRHCRCERKS